MYEQHMQRAARYAALALSDRRQQTSEYPELAVLRQDLLIALDESLRLLTSTTPHPDRPTSIASLTAHPVQALVDQLALARASGLAEWEDRAAPTERWVPRPHDPSSANGLLPTWRGMAVEAVLARYALDPVAHRLAEPTRWRCLADVATLAEAAAVLDGRLGDLLFSAPKARRAWRESAAILEVTAREARAWAGNPDAPPVPAPVATNVVIISDLDQLPLATDRLARLLHREATGPRPGLTSVLASLTALAHVSNAAADALDAAQQHQPAGAADLIAGTSQALRSHATTLAEALRTHRTRLGCTSTGSAATLAQARELGAAALPRIRDLRARPARALAASPTLLAYGPVAVRATDAARAAVQQLSDQGLLMVRTESEDVVYLGWHETRYVGGHQPFLDALDRAAAAARRCPPDPGRTAAPITPAQESPATLLGHELARQREQRRPSHPSVPISAYPMLSR